MPKAVTADEHFVASVVNIFESLPLPSAEKHREIIQSVGQGRKVSIKNASTSKARRCVENV